MEHAGSSGSDRELVIDNGVQQIKVEFRLKETADF
jgi:hypothetical protein